MVKHFPAVILTIAVIGCVSGCQDDSSSIQVPSNSEITKPGTGDGSVENPGTGDGSVENPGTGDGSEENPGTGDGSEENPGTGDVDNPNVPGEDEDPEVIVDNEDPEVTAESDYPDPQNTGEETEPSEPEDPQPITITEIVRIVSGAASIPTTTLKGKKIAVVGNSFIYWGNFVDGDNKKCKVKKDTKGYFYTTAKENGGAPVVYNYTHGGRNLDYIYSHCIQALDKKMRESINYVLLSEAGENNVKIEDTVKKIMKKFPNATCVFMPHEYHYHNKHKLLDHLNGLKKNEKCLIANIGQLEYNVYNGQEKDLKYSYNRRSFHGYRKYTQKGKQKLDNYHPNPLSGYLESLLAYSVLTKKTAVGMDYKFTADFVGSKYNPSTFAKFKEKNYNNGKGTNFDKILKDDSEMKKLQGIVDKYIKKWNNFEPTDTCSQSVTEVQISDIKEIYFSGSTNTNGVAYAECDQCECQKNLTVEIKTSEQRENIMLISPADLKDAGESTVKDYMTAGKGNVFYQTKDGWGRAGFSSIHGMASLCDGNRDAVQTKDGSQLHWQIADKSKTYDAEGNLSGDGKYISLIGYHLNQSKAVSGFTLFIDAIAKNTLASFDLLGGIKNADGSYTWQVLWSGSKIDYINYNKNTKFIHSDFEETAIDAIQIGVIQTEGNAIYASELEVYGH